MFQLATSFHERAQRYRLIDRRLSQHTRFFAAAAVVNDSLTALSTASGRLLMSNPTRAFLDHLGRDLEAFNDGIVRSIEDRRLQGPNLDARIVQTEQSRVQERLDEFYRHHAPAGRRSLIVELNGMMALLRLCSRLVRATSCQSLSMVLANVHAHTRRPLEFSRQTDREAIGNGLIAAVRAG